VEKEKYVLKAGSVVISTMGHDAGRKYLVLEVLDKDFVKVTDGKHRDLNNPKRKRIKHTKLTPLVIERFKELPKGKTELKKLNNEVANALKKCDTDKK